MTKTRVMMSILSFFIFAFCLLWTKQVWAQTGFLSYGSVDRVQIFYRTVPGQTGSELPLALSSGLKEVDRALQELAGSSIFKQLPSSFVLVDPNYKKSGGLFVPDFKMEGRPGVLLGLDNLVTSAQAKRVLAHELAHVLFHQSNPTESPWVNEGVAMLIESLVTGAMSSAIRDAFLNPEVTLTGKFDPRLESYQSGSNQSAQYGNVQLYFHYLYRLCGKDQFLRWILEPKNSKLPLLDSLLSSHTCVVGKNFKESFVSYSVAKAMQDYNDPIHYVFEGALNMDVLDHPAILEPYSETLYRVPVGGHCKAGEIPWGKRRCIRVRLE